MRPHFLFFFCSIVGAQKRAKGKVVELKELEYGGKNGICCLDIEEKKGDGRRNKECRKSHTHRMS